MWIIFIYLLSYLCIQFGLKDLLQSSWMVSSLVIPRKLGAIDNNKIRSLIFKVSAQFLTIRKDK